MTDAHAPDGHRFLANPSDEWYPVYRSERLRRAPVSVTLMGKPLVLFRTASGEPAALIDRCPHRNVPLSLGKVRGDNLRCIYHGWEFDRGGQCRAVPGLIGDTRAHDWATDDDKPKPAVLAALHALRPDKDHVTVIGAAGPPANLSIVDVRLLDRLAVAGVPTTFAIEVHNHGPPVPPELQGSLVNPFRRGDRDSRTTKTAGLGLGLYISREIVAAHGGQLDFESDAERGTTFRVSLPVRMEVVG